MIHTENKAKRIDKKETFAFLKKHQKFLVIGYIGHVVGLIVMLLMQNAIALWMRQFNVPAWGQSNDPLPPFINDPRDGAAATYAAPAPVAPTAPAAGLISK